MNDFLWALYDCHYIFITWDEYLEDLGEIYSLNNRNELQIFKMHIEHKMIP